MPKPIESCTQSEVEVICQEVWIVSLSAPKLPLQIDDAARQITDDVLELIFLNYKC